MATTASSLWRGVGPQPDLPLRFVTSTATFDGHDAAINIIRRLIQDQGGEVIHLGHNRRVDEIVAAAVEEDVDAVAVSSYQGGHMEFFGYLVERLRGAGAPRVRVFAGGGGTITADEASALHAAGVERVYLPADGTLLGLEGMVADLVQRAQAARDHGRPLPEPEPATPSTVARWITAIERGELEDGALDRVATGGGPVIGITGTGGAGKSSVLDELLQRLLRADSRLRVAVLAVDPTRRRSGGALLGDRIRMNSAASPRVFMRSLATRRPDLATSAALPHCIRLLRSLYDLVFVETAGTGQSDTGVVELADLSLYVMTNDYGAETQLEKIQMLDYADLVVLNKFDKRGAQDALRDIRRQWRRNHRRFGTVDNDVPVFPTVASRFGDGGMDRLFSALVRRLDGVSAALPPGDGGDMVGGLIPPERAGYLSRIAANGREAARQAQRHAAAAARAQHCYEALRLLADPELPPPLVPSAAAGDGDDAIPALRREYNAALEEIGESGRVALERWDSQREAARSERFRYEVRGQDVTGENYVETLSRLRVPKLAFPSYEDWGERLRFSLEENLPGRFPYTAGVYPYRRGDEDPTRMFAGEGTPERTNRRFHYLAAGQPSVRLSTAFDPIALYGEDPQPQPDVFGRIGMSGVSIATLDDMKKLYSGFDLCDRKTSVSMTINGPAPVMLAWFFDAAIDQQVERHLRESGKWREAEKQIAERFRDHPRPAYRGDLPEGHDGLGLGLLGVSGAELVPPDTYSRIRAHTLSVVRGTVQADILKEEQAQNECIFPLELGLRLMGDVQAFFCANDVRNYYGVSVSGYHIAEAGANPVTQLAFTLANGFTLIEYYLARGMKVDDFAPQFSFFFCNGMDAEYAVIGRVARRVWARALRDLYGANARSQMLKYHVQTSGRSLHAQALDLNDIRTTLQALYAVYDNCNSLHTNAYDEALTTPTEASARRALAIQLIINRELGLNFNQNPLQGSYAIEALTDSVEEAVYSEFDRLSARGDVLGAMETQYQRSCIQDQSLHYEARKHDGSLPIVGVNTFVAGGATAAEGAGSELVRSSDEERRNQIDAVEQFKAAHAAQAPAALDALQRTVLGGGNIFETLMDSARVCSLAQITHALYEVGGRYRRRM
jgi:methylmalonyl-CoA mutase